MPARLLDPGGARIGRGGHSKCRGADPYIGRGVRCAFSRWVAGHRGAPLEYFPARELPPPFLCQPRGERGHLRIGSAGLRARARRDRPTDRRRTGRGRSVKIGGRSPPFPDAELIPTLAALLNEAGLTEIANALSVRRL